jgi:hypothetical protein
MGRGREITMDSKLEWWMFHWNTAYSLGGSRLPVQKRREKKKSGKLASFSPAEN